MRQILLPLIIIAAAATFAAGQKTNVITQINELTDMSGCWEMRDDSRNLLIVETWSPATGKLMSGKGQTFKDGRKTDWEEMRIEQRPDGIYFVARPRENSEETAFKMVFSYVNEVVFENKQHDFPQRVIYKFDGDELTARVEGTNGGETKANVFPMKRTKCK